MVSRDLTKVLNDQYPKEPETQAYLDQLHALSSLQVHGLLSRHTLGAGDVSATEIGAGGSALERSAPLRSAPERLSFEEDRSGKVRFVEVCAAEVRTLEVYTGQTPLW